MRGIVLVVTLLTIHALLTACQGEMTRPDKPGAIPENLTMTQLDGHDYSGGVTCAPVESPAPEYPISAARNCLSGTVTLDIAVEKDGSADVIDILDETHPRVFTREAVRAVDNWNFDTTVVNGEPQTMRCVVVMEFRYPCH